ncbi:MAG: hypothetical protein V7K47_19925 [Nostoc sp.]
MGTNLDGLKDYFDRLDSDGDGKISGDDILSLDLFGQGEKDAFTNGKGWGDIQPNDTFTFEQFRQLVQKIQNS